MSQGWWRAILGDQLGVCDQDFWKALRDNKPVGRPSRQPREEEIEQIPLWAADLLPARLGLSLGDIAQLGGDRTMGLRCRRTPSRGHLSWLASPCPTRTLSTPMPPAGR